MKTYILQQEALAIDAACNITHKLAMAALISQCVCLSHHTLHPSHTTETAESAIRASRLHAHVHTMPLGHWHQHLSASDAAWNVVPLYGRLGSFHANSVFPPRFVYQDHPSPDSR